MTTGQHTSRDFDSELTDLRTRLLAMGARCERAFELAIAAFWTVVPSLAREVKDIDRRIDQDEKEIDALILRVLALRQPVAYDLRVLTAGMKLVTDLERIGDEAVNISERGAQGSYARAAGIEEILNDMVQIAREMLRDVLDAFVRGDVERACAVIDRDDEVDQHYGHALDLITAYVEQHPHEASGAIAVLKVTKYIERIADHSTNIAEEVIFMVEGEDIRHARTNPPPPLGAPVAPAETPKPRPSSALMLQAKKATRRDP